MTRHLSLNAKFQPLIEPFPSNLLWKFHERDQFVTGWGVILRRYVIQLKRICCFVHTWSITSFLGGVSFIFQYPVMLQHDGLLHPDMFGFNTKAFKRWILLLILFSTALVLTPAACHDWFLSVHSDSITGGVRLHFLVCNWATKQHRACTTK